MEQILSICEFRCDLCLAYLHDIETHPEKGQLLSDGLHHKTSKPAG